MDDGEVTVHAGDIVIQRGTNHGWANRLGRICRTAIHAVYLPERRLNARVRVFVDYLADAFRDPPWHVD